ncbi:Chromosome-partitioning protein Spo0J [Gammaproteobacteria bacterium]|jgi:ParB family chromosome partitioning protein|nr:Chromosome-partitioning protein Spo0J [Gammaproteobacteria bacterium]
MTKGRNPLGRGIGALIPGAAAPAAPRATAASPETGLLEIEVDRIDPNPEQPRRRFEREPLEALAESIRSHGVLQPVVVRRAGDRYELLVGERRWRASKAAGRNTIPAVVSDVAPKDRLALALIENVQRHDLNPIELAHAFRDLAGTGMTQEEIGREVGFDRSSVANTIRLLELPRELQEDVEFGRLSAGHAKALLQITNPERRHALRDRIVAEDLSVRGAEEAARALGVSGGARRRNAARREAQDPNLASLVDALRQGLQTRVRVQGSASRGRIEIDYFGPEDLHRIAKRILEGR